ncbi:PaaI family thioesterase [Immundisolibacter sp.]|uniref:PaaI family thioesterase n=1 Tax=Immundisolibacter sp. TaxID=1934948 RepID=UPI003561DAAD
MSDPVIGPTHTFSDALAALPYAAFLGLEWHVDGVLHLPFRGDLVGNYRIGALHGGVVAAALECAAQVLLLQRGASAPSTVDFTVDYLRPAVSTDLYLRATAVRIGRAVANLRVDAWQTEPKRPVATGHGNFQLNTG